MSSDQAGHHGVFPNGKLYELYGSTEAGWVTLLRPDEQIERLGTLGREWGGSGPIKILDSKGDEVADGEVGELYSRTPYVFDGYWKNPEKTEEAFRLSPGERIIQEQIALALGVSRQPVQQALLLLKNQGILKEATGRGLVVAPLDAQHVENIYEMRAAIEGLACRLAALHRADQARKLGLSIIEAGRKAVASGSVSRMIAADIKFHELL